MMGLGWGVAWDVSKAVPASASTATVQPREPRRAKRDQPSAVLLSKLDRRRLPKPLSRWAFIHGIDAKEERVKYMITYTIRTTGLTYEQNLAGDEALLTAFSKWKPEEGLSIQAFVSNLSGTGGYVLAEADDPKVVTSFVSKFNYWNDIDVVPVIDVSEAVSIGHSSLAWARSSSKG
jgi:hypothetical protein